MSEIQESTETPETTETPKISKADAIADKIAKCDDAINFAVNKVLGYVGDHPWEEWLKIANRYIGLFLPAVIGISGVLAWAIGLIAAIKYELPLSLVLGVFGILVAAAFSMHLAPKALSLSRSFVEKSEPEAMRPEFLHILKVVVGLGGMVYAIYQLVQFTSSSFVGALVTAFLSILVTIVCTRPGLVGAKAAYPTNGVEEAITILLFPLRTLLSLLSFIVGIVAVVGFVYGVVQLFADGILSALFVFTGTALVPFLLPLVVYFITLLVMFILDFYRALVSIPRKLDDVRMTLESK